jgi:hypothetical protein
MTDDTAEWRRVLGHLTGARSPLGLYTVPEHSFRAAQLRLVSFIGG